MIREWLSVGIIFLFVGVTIAPTIAQNTETSQSTSRGNLLYVGGSGPGNFSTIQKAVDNASDGDTVFVLNNASPYYEHIHISTSLRLLGENKNTTVIDGGDFGDVLTINKTGVTVSGFTLRRNGWYDDGFVVHASNVTIQNNKVVSCGNGVKAYEVNNITITGNEFIENYIGVSLYGASHDVIANNTLNASYIIGIDLSESKDSTIIDGNTIIANTFIAEQSSYIGIRLWESSNTTIIRNTLVSLLDNCYMGLQLWMSNDNIIDQNIFVKNGITLYKSYQNVISETNSVNGKPLVFLKDEADKTIENAGQVILVQCERITVQNLVLSHPDTGITVYNSTDCIIKNSSISLCRNGIYIENSKRNTFSENTITSCQEGINTYKGTSNVIRNNTIQHNIYDGIILNELSSTVNKNIIEDNSIGICIAGKWNNKISGNAIENNSLGVYLIGTFHNIIEKNNFIRNSNDSFFEISLCNQWRQNFWEKPRLMPQIIQGYLLIWEYYPPVGGGFEIKVPWVNLDWHPAQKPYDIVGT
jgi:parallel beta-helix repeat protein